MPLPRGFVPPCLPTKAPQPPTGGAWLHEIKHDGFRVIAHKDGNRVRLYSRPGNHLTHRFPLIVETLARLRLRSCIIDGEAVACDGNGMPSYDIGFVHEGQPAEIKVDTFNFTRYGLLHGTVLNVSQDAITRDKQQPDGGKTAGSEEPTSEPKGQELNYAARVSLDRTQMQVDDKLVNLSPGMAVTVEIKTGSRRIISYLLSPPLKYRQ